MGSGSKHEAIDGPKASALLQVMRDAGAVDATARVTYLKRLEGGWSRHSYAARVAHDENDERSYIVRVRPRAPTLDTDLEQEFRTYLLLADEDLATPKVHGFAGADDTPFDGSFFVMDHLHGRAVNVWRGRDRRELEEDWDGPRGIANDLVSSLAAIHAIDIGRAAEAVTARSFLETVHHWRGIYEEARLVRDPVIDEAYVWVGDREPDPMDPCLIHGDFRIGNCLIDAGRITGILDWELSFVGDPRFDLGYLSLEYHAGKFTNPGSRLLNAVAEREWFHERYTELSGRAVDSEVIRTFAVLGGLMVFAIMTTGLRVFRRGATTDIRLAWTRFVLPGLRQDLASLMGW